jgi:hypothetical protein
MNMLADKQSHQRQGPLTGAALNCGRLPVRQIAVLVPMLVALQVVAPIVLPAAVYPAQATGQVLSNDTKNMSSLYSQGRYALAENMGREILRKDPTNLDVHYIMGNIYYKLNDPKSAAQQYHYCVQTGGKLPAAKLAASALARLTAKFKDLDAAGTEGATDSTDSDLLMPQDKPADLATLKRAEVTLQRAQDSLASKKKQLDITIIHTEEFARSRIREIPYNTIYRRMSAFAGIEASRDNEDYYTAPNYDRPVEVAHIRATETAKVHQYIDEYNSQQKTIIAGALKEVDTLLGGTSDPDGKSKSVASPKPGSEVKTIKPPSNTSEAVTACGITTHKEAAGQRVIMVSTGSAAHRAGLTPNDLIEQSTFIPGADILKLTIRREGKQYAIKLQPASSAATNAANERPAPTKSGPAGVQPKLTPSQIAWARIKESDIVFVQDMSAVMRLPLGDTGLSKWDWCAGRIVDFAESLSRGNSMGFTLIQCYQYVFEIYRDQNPGALRQRLGASRAMEAANIATPLESIASEYFDSHSQKPLLIMVFTDGHPERGESMEAAVKMIGEHVKSQDQVRLVFFQIGEDVQGTAELQLLDHDLTYAGHRYDIVDWVKFDELQESGLSRALLDAYERPRAVGKTAPPPMSLGLTIKLEQVRQQIAAAH